MLANNSRTFPRLARLERIVAYAGASCSSAAACILFADLVSPKMVLQGDGVTMARAYPVSVNLALLLLSVGATLLGWVFVNRVDPHGDG